MFGAHEPCGQIENRLRVGCVLRRNGSILRGHASSWFSSAQPRGPEKCSTSTVATARRKILSQVQIELSLHPNHSSPMTGASEVSQLASPLKCPMPHSSTVEESATGD